MLVREVVKIRRGECRRGLYLGRFQMFHNGHLNIIKHIDAQEDIDELLINIGSSQYNRQNKSLDAPGVINPFNFDERKEFLERSLKGEIKKPYKIIGVQDQHYCPSWIQNLVYVNPEFQVFFSNVKREREMFKQQGKDVREIPIKDKFHAQIIREMIAYGDDYKQYVPKGVVDVVEEFSLAKKLREFYKEHQDEIKEVYALQRKMGIACYADLFGEKKL